LVTLASALVGESVPYEIRVPVEEAFGATWVWDVEMRDDHERLCATSRVTIAVRDRGPQ